MCVSISSLLFAAHSLGQWYSVVIVEAHCKTECKNYLNLEIISFYQTHLSEGASNCREQKKPQIIIITIEARQPESFRLSLSF